MAWTPVWSLLLPSPGCSLMSEILFSPIIRPASLEVNVPRPTPDEVQQSAEGDGNYLQKHLLLTRERILELRGAFSGLQEPPRAGQTSDADRRGTTGSTVDLYFHTRLITVLEEGESSEARFRGLSVNLLV